MRAVVAYSHGARDILARAWDLLRDMYGTISAAVSVPCTAFSSIHIRVEKMAYKALPTPIIHAVPSFQPLVPRPDAVMNEPGCVCFLSPTSIQKITTNPETERKSVACVILGTALGHRKSGPAVFTISQLLSTGRARGMPCL